jgi:hypothetical protein
MSRTKMLIALAAAVAALTAPASARPARHFHQHRQVAVQYPNERPPLTVTKRSWLDPGPVTPAGATTPNYVATSTIFNLTTDQTFNTAGFGNDRLPRPLEVPGRPSPVLMFATGGPSVFRLDFVLARSPAYPYYPYWP